MFAHARVLPGLGSVVAAVLGVACLYGCSQVQETAAPPVHMSAQGTPEQDPVGNALFMTPSDLAAKADVPLYPGAATPEGLSTVQASKDGTRYEIVMSTPDIPEKVVKFYEGKLQKPETLPGRMTIMGMSPKGHYASVKVSHVSNRTDIKVVVTDESPAGASK